MPVVARAHDLLVNTDMGDMKQPENTIRWQESGTQGVGVLVSDTLMFQRGKPMTSDEHLGHVYGLALPLLKHGIPVDLKDALRKSASLSGPSGKAAAKNGARSRPARKRKS